MNGVVSIICLILINYSWVCAGNDEEYFIECENDDNAQIFNGTENITTFEIPISAFFLEEESQKLINATNGNFQNQATDIINSISDAHEQEVMEIVKQFKSTRRKRFLGLRALFSRIAHTGRRLYPRAETTIHKSSIPHKAIDGTKWAAKTVNEKIVSGAKWAAKTSAQLGALYAATVAYDKLTGSSEKIEVLKNATNFTLIKSTIDSSLNYAKNEKIHDLKMLLFFGKLNHLNFIVEYLKSINAGWIDIDKFHIKGDLIIIDTKTKFYTISGKLCEKHFIGSFADGYYSYNATSKSINDFEVQRCELNIFEQIFCYPKTFNSPQINVSVNQCYRRRTKSKIVFVTKTEKYFENEVEKDFPANGILVTTLIEKSDLIIPYCGVFSLRHHEEHFHSYPKILYTEEIIKMNKKLEEIEKKAAGNQGFFTKLSELLENDFLARVCLGIIMIALTVSLLFCLLYVNYICFCRKILPACRLC